MLKTYIVSIESKFPAWDETPGEVQVLAKDAKDAVSQARKLMARLGAFDRHDGPTIYRASRAI